MAQRLDEFLATASDAQIEPKSTSVMRLGDYLSTEEDSLDTKNIENAFYAPTTEEIQDWKSKGEIGYFEQAIRQDKTEMIPFNPEAAVKSIKLLRAINRMKADKYTDKDSKDKDFSTINDFLKKKEEERMRGYTIGGRITQGVAILPGYMIEFLSTGGLAALGRGTVKAAIKPAIRTIAKSKTLSFGVRNIGAVTGAVYRTAAMPHRVAKSYAERRVDQSLQLTEKGFKISDEAIEKPAISFMKAIGDVVIENYSEVTGGELTKFGKKFIPNSIARNIAMIFKKMHPNKSVTTLFTKMGWNGFIGELGEERVGGFLKALFNIEDFGAKNKESALDRIISSVPKGEEILVEAGVLAFPGATNVGVSQALDIMQKRKGKAREVIPEDLTKEKIGAVLTKKPEAKLTTLPTQIIDSAKVVNLPDMSNIAKATIILEDTPVLKSSNLFDPKTTNFDKAKSIAEKYYFETLFNKGIKCPAFNNQEVLFTEKGWEHITQSTPDRKLSDDNIKRRIKLLAKAKEIIETAQYVESVQEKPTKGQKTFALLGKFADGDAVRVIVEEINRGGKIFFSVFDVEDLGKKIRKIALPETPSDRSRFGAGKEPATSTTKSMPQKEGAVKEIPTKEVKPTETFTQTLQKLLQAIKDKQLLGKFAKEVYSVGFENVDFGDNIKIRDFLYGVEADSTSALENQLWLEAIMEEGKVPFIKKRETTLLKDRIKAIEQGLREGRIQTEKEIKKIQTELIEVIESVDLEAKDRAKFLKTIKNIQTREDLAKARPGIIDRITRLVEITDKGILATRITKELKTTKPIKVGQKRIEKYDYENSKLFKDLRNYNKLTQEKTQIELDAYPELVNTESDLIKKRFLSLKANGKSASLDLHKKVHEDILKLKAFGEEAKDKVDFERKVERKDRVDELLVTENKIKADKKAIKTKIVNVYRKGFSNIYSMLNSIFGKNIAEQYDPEKNENNRDTAIYFKTKEMTEETNKIYDTTNALKIFEYMGKMDYKLTDREGITIELTKLELIDIYNSLKNALTKERYYNAFGEQQVNYLMGELTPQDIEFADYLQEVVKDYREILNQRNIEITGRDLGFVENYWPATSEYEANVFDDIRLQGETPSALKERSASSKIIPIPTNAWFKVQKHIAQGEHVANLSREYETLRRLFTSRQIKHSIKNRFGDDVYKVLLNQIDNISLNAQVKKIDAVSEWFKVAINNWVSAKIAFNPSTFIRQLMSVGNYMENINSVDWVRDFHKGVLSPKKTFDFMWKNAPFLEARFNRGYSEAVKDAIEGAQKLNRKWGNWTTFLTSLVRSGDITAIIYGGYPLVQSELAKGKTLKQAMEIFEKATLKAQQSGLSSSLSQFQNSRNPFARLFLAFKNTANQYFRKMVDASISYSNQDIPLSQYSKTMFIYAVIQPILYVLAGFLTKQIFKGFRDIEEEAENLIKEIFSQFVIHPINAIPILDDIALYAMRRATGQKAWRVMNMPFLDDLSEGIQKLNKEEITAEDYLIAIAAVLEPGTGLPLKTIIRYNKYIQGKKGKKGTYR